MKRAQRKGGKRGEDSDRGEKSEDQRRRATRKMRRNPQKRNLKEEEKEYIDMMPGGKAVGGQQRMQRLTGRLLLSNVDMLRRVEGLESSTFFLAALNSRLFGGT